MIETLFGFGAALVPFWWVVLVITALVYYKSVLRFFGIILIPEDAVGIVNKKFALLGKNKTLPDGRIVALLGEAGYQADALAPGAHFWYWPWQYAIEITKFVTVPQGKVGIVEAKDGAPIPVGRVLGQAVGCDSFQDTRQFLESGGQRGPQMAIVPPGVFRINAALFSITLTSAVQIKQDQVGIVTTNEGTPLDSGEIAGPEIAGHNMYQNGQVFVDNGGRKGLQEQVMLAGTYYINPLFISVATVPMTEVSIGYVGVVVAYVGKKGTDISGEGFRHGNMVQRGEKGVWADVLDPGKYPINPHTHKVELVPTTNIVLNWATAKTESHALDANLSTITVRSSDGFTFNLDVSQIIHVSRTNAPKVIARFGNMSNLVTQVLEPLIGNYFRNSAQKSDVIDFLLKRSERQAEAKGHIEHALSEYDVQAVDSLIGDIVPPLELMKTLTDRKVAQQQQITYDTQRQAEAGRQLLEEQTALADTRKEVVAAERRVTVAGQDAKAAVNKATGEAEAKTINAKADAEVIITVGNAKATQTNAVGGAEADVLKRKAEYVGPAAYALMEIAKDLAASKVKLVPEIVVSGSGGDNKGGGIVDALLGVSLQRLTEQAVTAHPHEKAPVSTEKSAASKIG